MAEEVAVPVAASPAADGPLVVRSEVPDLAEYGQYKPYLRFDFFFSCAYCTMSEAEASAIRFTIDHYESQKSHPELTNVYTNLMYACDECNSRKIDISPPPAARAAGYRFFRPDADIHSEHFKQGRVRDGIEIEPVSSTGEFTIDALDLNRASLRRLRRIRADLIECNAFLAHGVAGLKRFPIDRLPPQMKGRARGAISEALEMIEATEEQIEDVLRAYAHSELIDPEDQAIKSERDEERKRAMKQLKVLFPGVWLGRHASKKAVG